MSYTYPTVNDFKNFFVRDFPYGTDMATSILDADITKAFAEAEFNFNSSFFSTQERFNLGYLLLSAHYLVTSIKASSQGISGQYSWNQINKSVGSVSEASQLPQRVIDNPEMMMLSKTPYGARYLNLILPQLVGNVFTVCGRTRA